MQITFDWVVFGLAGTAVVVALGLKYFRNRKSSSAAPDSRVVVALLSAVLILHTGRYMNPDRPVPDSPYVSLLLVVLLLLAINESVWRAHSKIASESERKES
jgi:hypothetical protein